MNSENIRHSLERIFGKTCNKIMTAGITGSLIGASFVTGGLLICRTTMSRLQIAKFSSIGALLGGAAGLITTRVALRNKESYETERQLDSLNLKLTDANIMTIIEDAFKDTNSGEYLRKIVDAKTPEERDRLKNEWTKKADKWKEKSLTDVISMR